MKKIFLLGMVFTMSLFAGAQPLVLNTEKIADNIQAPTAMAFPGNGEIWVTEQTGKIRVIKNGQISHGEARTFEMPKVV